MRQWGTGMEAAVMQGGPHDGAEFGTVDPDRYTGHGYDSVNGIATVWYWFTGKKDWKGRWIFRCENHLWRLKRFWYARQGVHLKERPVWAPPIKVRTYHYCEQEGCEGLGVEGNDNIVDGKKTCDYCSVKLMKFGGEG